MTKHTLWIGGCIAAIVSSALLAAPPSVRLDLGPPSFEVSHGWLSWQTPCNDGFGPLLRKIPPSLVDPDGFQITLGPVHSLGSRTVKSARGEQAAVIAESVFAPAATPMTLTVSGLRPGTYRLALWLNDARGYVWPPVTVLLDDAHGRGRQVVTDLPQTATKDSSKASRGSLEFTAEAGSAVVVTVSVPTATKAAYVFLSGLEIARTDEPSPATVQELARPMCPFPSVGQIGISPDATLRWRTYVPNATWQLFAGPSPDALTRLASGLTEPWWRGCFSPGTQLFWRVDTQLSQQTIRGPVWQFSCSDKLSIDDFEDYSPTQRLSDRWDDGRAQHPGRGPVVSLSNDGSQTLQLRLGGGELKVQRMLDDHPNWTLGGMQRLLARFRCIPADLNPALALQLVDHSGRTICLPLTAAATSPFSKGWRALSATLPGTAEIDIATLQEMTLIVKTSGFGQLYLDDIRLDRLHSEPATPVVPLHYGRLDTLPGGPPALRTVASSVPEIELRTDVCVVGGGSGGIGAALAAARKGARVILVERQDILGGTSTAGGISNWEPGPGCPLAEEIYERLVQCTPAVISDKATYAQTLTRAQSGHIGFEPDAFHETVTKMLTETSMCRIFLSTMCTVVKVETNSMRVVEVCCEGRDGSVYRIKAGTFIDCTGGGFLCQAAGCEVMLGKDSRSRFGESSAPDVASDQLNAIELVYRIRPSATPLRQPLPEGMKLRRGGAAWPLPSGDRFVNTCGGLAPGQMLMSLGYEGTRTELERRALAHWHGLQKTKYPEYEFDSFAPMLAIRESYRVVGEYVLTQNDLTAGIAKQTHSDLIAIADHPMDTHGAGGGLSAVAAPYGIPFRCLVPKGGWRNLLVACRASSFSHLAASSCRLSRTMMALGHAAGLAAAQCALSGGDIQHIDVAIIQEELGMPPAP